MDNDINEYLAALSGGHPGSIYGTNQAGAPEAFERIMRDSRKINGGDTAHQVIIGKTRDGMSSFTKSIPSKSGASRATCLLAGLMRRI